MKKYLEYIKETNDITAFYKKEWFNSVYDYNVDRVKELLEEDFDVNTKDKYGLSALLISAKYGFNYMMKVLIDHHANLNDVDPLGKSALMIAVEYSHYDMLTSLIDAGVDIGIKDKNGYSFLEYSEEILDQLIEDVNDMSSVLEYGKSFVESYNFQKQLIKYKKEDMILKIYDAGILDDRIIKDNPVLFKTKEWGLI